jgi:TIR domain/Putative Ig domain
MAQPQRDAPVTARPATATDRVPRSLAVAVRLHGLSLGGGVGDQAGPDFFISYTSADAAWAKWISTELERAGHTTVSQVQDFRAGHDFVHEMDRAVASAERTIAVLSPAYLASEFGEAEWRAAFVEDPSGERGKLVPVKVQACQPPGLPRARVHIDLVGVDTDTARMRLLEGGRAGGTAATTNHLLRPCGLSRDVGAACDDLGITTGSLPPIKLGEEWSVVFRASGGVEPRTWSIISGAVPDGLELDPENGRLDGTATRPGQAAAFEISVRDSRGEHATRRFELSVPEPPLPGDINGDRAVDCADMNILRSDWGQTGSDLRSDLNDDKTVGTTDMSIMLSHWTGETSDSNC